jgi:hypothetical protein
LAQVHKTKSQSTVPESGTTIASKATRDGVAQRLAAPAVPKSLAVAVALRPSDAQLLGDVARTLGKAATHHDATTHAL